MGEYRLPHALIGERERLGLMSALLDPFERAHFVRLGVSRGWRCLELGCGNGSIARILAELVGPTGHVVASDIDIGYLADLKAPNLETRRIDVLEGPIEEGSYDLVVARALLHHIPAARTVVERMVRAAKRGGVVLSIEPDMLPCMVAEPESMREFWRGWLGWSVDSGIDYFIGRKLPAWLDALGLEGVAAEGSTAHFNGGSDWATYWASTMREVAPSLLRSGQVTERRLYDFHRNFEDPHYWTSVISFVATSGRKPA
jgi:SAM-dependent methyltransferase